MNEGEASMRLGLDGAPGLAEDVIVARDLLIGRRHRQGLAHRARHHRHLVGLDSLGPRARRCA